MDRRSFLSWVGVGWIASCLPVAIAACSNTSTSGNAPQASAPRSSPRADGFQAVGTVATLDQSGQLLVKDFVGGSVLVVRDPANPNAIAAVSPTCTHQGCIVEWKTDQKAFVCPCHAAKFATNGQVLESPASRPLQTFTAKVEGDSILVKA
ncbi:MAG: Rieske (2Fe-2S) protein [Oscillatoriales cyanobacterium C42_A2020_001]|nr:Rieske (2Fe-2S) protein [Leptolyngbyaceae cyanobacterium C42_A2020_001]